MESGRSPEIHGHPPGGTGRPPDSGRSETLPPGSTETVGAEGGPCANVPIGESASGSGERARVDHARSTEARPGEAESVRR